MNRNANDTEDRIPPGVGISRVKIRTLNGMYVFVCADELSDKGHDGVHVLNQPLGYVGYIIIIITCTTTGDGYEEKSYSVPFRCVFGGFCFSIINTRARARDTHHDNIVHHRFRYPCFI